MDAARAPRKRLRPLRRKITTTGLPERRASAASLRGAACRAGAGLSRSRSPTPHAGQEPDPSRYDDALYGQLDPARSTSQHDPAYADDPYAYQDGYGDGAEEPVKKRGGGMITVAVVLALAVVGTGAAFAYRTYVGSPRSGEPPIIKADNSPTKIVPAPADGSAKVPDRMATGDGTEKIVPREEAPVDVNARTGPRVVFPPLNPNSNPPSAASVAPAGPPPARRGQRHAADATSRAGSRPLPSAAIRPTEPRVPVNAPPPAKPAPAPKPLRLRAAAAPLRPRLPRAARPHRPMRAPTRRCR